LLFSAWGSFIYSNTLESPFVFDDDLRIVNNHSIQISQLNPKEIWEAAFGKKSAANRPIGNISFALNYYFHQLDVKGYHIVNIIIHILTGIFLYLFLAATLSLPSVKTQYERASVLAFFAALVWLVHPVQTQSVTYIVQRVNSLSAMFYVLSFLLYLKGRLAPKTRKNWFWFVFSALSWILALGCKQNAALLPFFVFLYEWYFFQDLSRDWLKRNWKYFLGIVALFAIIALIYMEMHPLERVSKMHDFARREFTVTERGLTQFRVVLYYISLLFYPHPSRLNLDYDFFLSRSLIDPPTTLLSLFTIIILLALAFYIAKKERLISFCILWFFGNLVIESSIIPLAIIFEHRVYLPSMLVCLIPVALIYRFTKLDWLRIGLFSAVLVALSLWTYQRNQAWQDDVTLWRDTVKKSPNKGRPYNNLGSALLEKGNTAEALEHLNKAISLDPNMHEAHLNLGYIMRQKEKSEEAILYFSNALRINPKFSRAHHNLAIVLAEEGKTDEAIEHFYKALSIDPDFAESHESHYNLGFLLAEQGETEDAIKHYAEALQIKPEYAEVHYNLGTLLIEQGKTAEGIEHLNEAIRIDPDLAEAHSHLAFVLAGQGKTEEAIHHFLEVLRINPDDADVHINLGTALLHKGRTSEAIGHFREALRIDSELPEAHINLGAVLVQKGKIDEAIDHFRKALKIDPDASDAKTNLEKALALQGKMDRAIANMKKALTLKPEDAELHYRLAVLYQSRGRADEAIEQYQEALSLDPEFAEALNDLAVAYAIKAEYEEALPLFKKTVKLRPDDPGPYYNVARIYAVQNKIEESIDWLEKAVEKGFSDWHSVKTDEYLENIRGSSRYEQVIKGH
jgi:tetratricopeptide (TPR) repeat protein